MLCFETVTNISLSLQHNRVARIKSVVFASFSVKVLYQCCSLFAECAMLILKFGCKLFARMSGVNSHSCRSLSPHHLTYIHSEMQLRNVMLPVPVY